MVHGAFALIAGTNLTRMDPATEALYTNPEVLAVDQHSKRNRQLIRSGPLVVWTAEPEAGGGRYIAVFNLGDSEQAATFAWKDLELTAGAHAVRDLWARKNLAKADSFQALLPPHAALLYRVQ